jgi:hypothetical protein
MRARANSATMASAGGSIAANCSKKRLTFLRSYRWMSGMVSAPAKANASVTSAARESARRSGFRGVAVVT